MLTFDPSDFVARGIAFHKALGPRTDHWLDKAGRESIDRMTDGRYWTQRTGEMNRTLRLVAPGEFRRRVVAQSKHAAFLQYGTKAHVIRPKLARNFVGPAQESQGRRKRGTGGARHALRFVANGGGLIFARAVKHPGTRGYFYVEKESDWMSTMLPRLGGYARDEALASSGFG
jgi:hypothetical protein